MRGIYVFVILFIIPYHCLPQLLPKEGSKLNYRLLGVSFPPDRNAQKYLIEIADGNFYSEDSFKRNIIQTINCKENKKIVEVPLFDRNYTWRVSSVTLKDTLSKSRLHHFSTYLVANADTAKFRLRILQHSERYKDYYVSTDGGGVLYDMNGAPVWFVPEKNGVGSYVADMKFTPEGTVTFLYKQPYELNFNGDILWHVKKNGVVSGDTLGEFFHHEFTRLPNGHFMALGSQKLLCKTDSVGDSVYIEVSKEHGKVEKDGYRYGLFGTLIEYGLDGEVVWSWKSSTYLIGSDFDYYKAPDGNLKYQPHDNSFFYDEKNSCIYMGFRNINRIIKIDYPSGKVLATYGDCFRPGARSNGGGIFCGQHSIGRTYDGYLYVFNNNSCLHNDSLPTVVLLKEPVLHGEQLQKEWEFTCPVEQKAPRKYGSGGNVYEMADHSMLINMGSEYSKLMIVNRDKEVLWAALAERYVFTDRIWVSNHQYRANIISRNELEKLIWRAENYGR